MLKLKNAIKIKYFKKKPLDSGESVVPGCKLRI